MTRFLRRLLTGAVALAPAPAGFAETVVQDVTVTASIEAACTALSATLNFGTYDPDGNGPLDTSAPIRLDCPEDVWVVIRLDGGLNPHDNDRRMTAGGENFLRYNLFTGFGPRGRLWGDGTEFGEPLTHFHSSSVFDPDVFGRIPAGQRVAPGFYTDTVTITVDIDATQ